MSRKVSYNIGIVFVFNNYYMTTNCFNNG